MFKDLISTSIISSIITMGNFVVLELEREISPRETFEGNTSRHAPHHTTPGEHVCVRTVFRLAQQDIPQEPL